MCIIFNYLIIIVISVARERGLFGPIEDTSADGSPSSSGDQIHQVGGTNHDAHGYIYIYMQGSKSSSVRGSG